MIIVIIAGGSGTRLWPLSQADYPKHLLKLTGDRSLLQNTVGRAAKVTSDIYVVTEQSHADEVARQLPEFDNTHILIEPGRRGTASCFLLALAAIKRHHPSTEPVIFIHADHYITDEDAFAETVRLAGESSERHQRITLVGIKPTYPATGFGYIEVGDEVERRDGLGVSAVRQFKEKPKVTTAERYLKAGHYLWNQGLFAAPEAVFSHAFAEHAPDLAAEYLQLQKVIDEPKAATQTYLGFTSQPIDTALIERTPDLLVVTGTYDWADIGSFFDLHKILQDKAKNAIQGDVELIGCEDVMVNGSDKPVIVIGLSGVVVVDSPHGLLVCAKDQSQLVGEAAKRLQARTNPDPSAKP